MNEMPLEFFRKKIPPNLPLPKGGVAIPPLTKGDEGGLSISLVRGWLIQNRKLIKLSVFNY